MTHTPSTRTRARRLGGALAGALALSAIPLASPAWAGHDEPLQDFTATACPVADNETPEDFTDDTTVVPDDGFTDVPGNNVHEFAVDCVAWYEITSGKTATTYDPSGSVRRDQMASFIANLIDYVADRTEAEDGLGEPPVANQFPCDLDDDNVHYDSIQRLAAAEVVAGTGSSSAGACYDPDGTVTRAQMATFIKNAQDVVGTAVPATETDYFVDDNTSVHEDNINAIHAEGIAAGTGANAADEDLYDPISDVRRDQMASFLARKLERLVADTAVGIPPYADITVDPDEDTYEPEAEITFTAAGEGGDVESVSASGCGSAVVTSEDPVDEVVLTIPVDQADGECTVTVVTSFEDVADVFAGQGRTGTTVVELEIDDGE